MYLMSHIMISRDSNPCTFAAFGFKLELWQLRLIDVHTVVVLGF